MLELSTVNPQLAALNHEGQSIWYDNCSRDVLNSGELARLIGQGVSGLTSNPTIFNKAIAGSNNYDSEIQRLAGQGLPTEQICEKLMIADVRAAAELLRPIWERSKGRDGFASIEVSPLLANDRAGTVAAARRIWNELNCPNAMIKIPATEAGLPAIRQVLEEGINVNVTLLFSVDMYRRVMQEHQAALTTRQEQNLPNDKLASVASFFVSRVDTIMQQSLAELNDSAAAEPLHGKVAVANARLAYQAFLEAYQTPAFQALADQGAQVQRPLWASTSTKDPQLPKLLYVETLVGPDTVNTVPPETLKTILQGAEVGPTVDSDFSGAQSTITAARSLAEQGIVFDKLLDRLLAAGVESFADAYRQLLTSIGEKSRQVLGESGSLAGLSGPPAA